MPAVSPDGGDPPAEELEASIPERTPEAILAV
jgi:hypothetical protein